MITGAKRAKMGHKPRGHISERLYRMLFVYFIATTTLPYPKLHIRNQVR